MDVLDRTDLPFPQSLPEFQRLFSDDAACAAYMERACWGDGFACPHCGVVGEPFRIATRPGVLTCRVRGHGTAHRRQGRGSRTRRRREDGGREASFRPPEQAGLFAEPGSGAGGIVRRYLDTAQAAVYLGIGARTLARMRAAGEGPRHARIGRRVIYDIADLDAWIEEFKSPVAGRARRA